MRENHTLNRLRCLPLALALLFLASPAFAGSPKCFLHGIISPSSGNLEKPSVSDMIRMRFDADTQLKCEQMLKAYCQYNVKEKNYSPTRLKGSFKLDMEKTEEVKYTYDAKCKLLVEGE